MRLKVKRGAGTLSLLYDEARLPSDARKGLNWMLRANLFGNLHGVICGGGTAAMVGLAGLLGAGDLEFGLLVAIPQIAAFLQIPFSILVNRTRRRKIYLLTLGLLSRFLWLLFGFAPLLSNMPDDKAPLYVLITLLGLSSACGAVINVTWFPWYSDLAPLKIRGRWLSYRDMLNNSLVLPFGLLVAWLLDVLGLETRFIVIFLVGGVLGCLDMLCFGFIREVPMPENAGISFRKTFSGVFHNKAFLRVTLMWTVWCFTANMSGAYLTPYAMNVMGLNFMQMTLFGTVAAAVSTVIMVPRWGRMLDRYGSRSVMLVSAIGASLTPIFFLLSTPGSIWPVLLHNLIGAFFWCGSNLAANSLQLFASPDTERSSYIAFFSCVTCLAGTAFGTMCGGFFLDSCVRTGLFAGRFDRYMALILLSVILRFASVLLFVPRLQNENDETAANMLRAIRKKRYSHKV